FDSSFLPRHPYTRDLHSFPTRRSSDLAAGFENIKWPAVVFFRHPNFRLQIAQPFVLEMGKTLYDISEASDFLCRVPGRFLRPIQDRKSTRLNSSHVAISYAVFCLKKKN